MALVDYIPNRPEEFVGNPTDPGYERNMINYQRNVAAYYSFIQAAQQEQAQEATSKSALQKAAHDVIMEIARRFA